MPAAVIYVTNQTTTAYRAIEEQFTAEMQARAAAVEQAWAYYDGLMPQPLRVEGDGYNDNVTLPKVDQVADKLVSLLYGDGIDWTVGVDDTEGADEAVEALWDASQGEHLLHNIGLSGCLAGHVFVRIVPRLADLPKLVNLNPANVAVFWDVADVDRVLWYRLQFTVGESGRRIDYVLGKDTEQGWDHSAQGWTERVYDYYPRRSQPWELVSEMPWPYDWPPIVDWQNLPRPFQRYGLNDVRRAIALNDAINFVASNYNRILKHHGSPKTVGIGFDADEVVGTSVGGLFTVNKPRNEADLFNLEMQSDLGSAREFLGLLMREIWQSARLLDPQSIKDSVGSLTNFGLRVLYADAIAKIQTKRLLYGEGLAEVTRRAFAISGQPVPEALQVRWPDVLPEDSTQIANALLKELEAGVLDMQTYRELRNYDHEQIEERLQAEKANETSLGEQLLTAFARGADNGRQAIQGNTQGQAPGREQGTQVGEEVNRG